MTQPKTVLLTGCSGFIAKHIAVRLLNAGYHVVGSLRSVARSGEIIAAVSPHLDTTDDLEQRFRFVALNLDADDGWVEAAKGADILMHTASPFPLEQPDNEDDVIRPAVDGVLRAMRAAKEAGITRVVLTSSAVAIMDSDLPEGRTTYDEGDWSNLNHPGMSPYAKSKTMAEMAAWDFVKTQAPEMELTTINPVFVLGPPLDRHFGTSVGVVQRLLQARDPMLPRFGFPTVDVRDVAEMHVRALSTPESIGNRIIASESFMWFYEIAELLKAAFPDRKIVTRRAPNILVRILARFDKSIRAIVPILGVKIDISNARARKVFDMKFIPATDSALATAIYLTENDLVD